MKIRVAVTGLSGLIGRHLIDDFSQKYELNEMFRSQPILTNKMGKSFRVDLTNQYDLMKTLHLIRPDVVLHLAAKTHIDACQEEAHLGNTSESWKINVGATHSLANYCQQNNCHLVLMSTECVFDGQKKSYLETDALNPINWYGITKTAAEEQVTGMIGKNTIVRGVIAYSNHSLGAKTLYGQILQQLKAQQTVNLVNDQLMTPTYIPDLVTALMKIIDHKIYGTLHITPSQKLTPFTFGQIMAAHLNYNLDLIQQTSLIDYLGKTRAALRVKHACLDSRLSARVLKMKFRNIGEVLTS